MANNDNTFGVPFNKNKKYGGGVFATELNDNIGIKMWFWQLTIQKPNPDILPFWYQH